VAATSISLGQAIGRVGCFFYGCCFGKAVEAHSFWYTFAVKFPGHQVYRHPTQLYSSIANLCIFLTLIYIGKRTKNAGMVVVSYFYIYGLFRFLIEFLRDDVRLTILGVQSLSTSQTVSLIGILFGIILHIYVHKTARNN
jgi:phosphatidylglycerol:prolipoprotein diacylglycerol transferase